MPFFKNIPIAFYLKRPHILLILFTYTSHGAALFQQHFKATLLSISKSVGETGPECFISRATNDSQKEAQDFVIGALVTSGVKVICDEPSVEFSGEKKNCYKHLPFGGNAQTFMQYIGNVPFVVSLYTPLYLTRSESSDPDAGIPQEVERICRRINEKAEAHPQFFSALLLFGNKQTSVPIRLGNYLFSPCIDQSGQFDQRLCCLQIMSLLEQKFFLGNQAVQNIINVFIQTTNTLKGYEEVKRHLLPQRIILQHPEFFMASYIPPLPLFLESGQNTPEGSYLHRLKKWFDRSGQENRKCLVTYNHDRCSLSGMGGIGKTTLALKLAHDAVKHNERRYNIIWWIASETKKSFLDGYKDLLRDLTLRQKLNIDIEVLSEDDLIKAVCKYVQPYKTLLILDNVPRSYDDKDSASMAESYLHTRLPSTNADIIFTSRESNWMCHKIDVDTFSEEEAITYLLTTTKSEDRNSARNIAIEMGNLPLALSYAAAYIREKRITIAKYLELYETSKQKMLSYHPRVKDYPYTVSGAFDVSFQHLNEEERNLLYMLCYLDPDKIYIELLSFSDGKMICGFIKCFETLESLSLIKWDREINTISIHRILQYIIRSGSKSVEEKLFNKLLSRFYHGFIENLKWLDSRNNVLLYAQLNNLMKQLKTLSSYGCDTWFEEMKTRQELYNCLICLDEITDHDPIIQQFLDWSDEKLTNAVLTCKRYGCYLQSPTLRSRLFCFMDEKDLLSIFECTQSIPNFKELTDEEKLNLIAALSTIPQNIAKPLILFCADKMFDQKYLPGLFMKIYFVTSDINQSKIMAEFLTDKNYTFFSREDFRELEDSKKGCKATEVVRRCARKLTIKKMEGLEIVKILNALVEIYESKEEYDFEGLVEDCKVLVTQRMEGGDIAETLWTAHGLDAKNRKDVINRAKKIITDTIKKSDDVPPILSAINRVPIEQRESLLNLCTQLFREGMDGVSTNVIIDNVNEIPEHDRENIVGLSLVLISEDMAGFCIATIFDAVGRISEDDRKNVIDFALHLISKDMLGMDVANILDGISDIPKQDREKVITHAKSLITNKMDGDEIAEILKKSRDVCN